MTQTFDEALEEYLGAASDAYDIRAIVRRFWLFDFDGHPIRVWHGQGVSEDTNNIEWFGTIDAGGVDHLTVPAISDGRDGASAKLEFKLSYIDEAMQAALKADQDLVKGRRLTGYLGIFKKGDGLRQSVPLKFYRRFTMQHAKFEQNTTLDQESGTIRVTYSASVVVKNDNAGRSLAPRLTATPEGQRRWAAIMGVSGTDKGMDFVPGLANRTYQFQN